VKPQYGSGDQRDKRIVEVSLYVVTHEATTLGELVVEAVGTIGTDPPGSDGERRRRLSEAGRTCREVSSRVLHRHLD